MFELNIETDNAAFEDEDGAFEVARILRLVASQLERGARSAPILDVNGNRVGSYNLPRA